jgi:hypothetical protein
MCRGVQADADQVVAANGPAAVCPRSSLDTVHGGMRVVVHTVMMALVSLIPLCFCCIAGCAGAWENALLSRSCTGRWQHDSKPVASKPSCAISSQQQEFTAGG